MFASNVSFVNFLELASHFSCHKEIPPFYIDTEDTSKMLEIFQYSFELMYDDTSNFLRIVDYERAEEKYLDVMLIESGWIVKVEMTLSMKRKIVKLAQYIYTMKGIAKGMIYVVKQLINIVIEIADGVEEGFILNFNELGVDTILGYSGYFLHFIVKTPTITPEKELLVEKIIDFMRWAVNTFSIEQTL